MPTIAELKAQLDAAGVEYPAKAKKADLMELLVEHVYGDPEPEPEPEVEQDVIAQALVLEVPLREAADTYAAGDNSDAVKSALRNASHGIAHIRKVFDANARVAR